MPAEVVEAAILSWGRGIHEEHEPELGLFVTDAVYVLMKGGLFYQYLKTPPKELNRRKAWARGVSPADWAAVSEEVHLVRFAEVTELDARPAVDGRCDLAFLPMGAASEQGVFGFGLIEAYGGLTPAEVIQYVQGTEP
jgi:hypothetical protein